jgi:hypothetical protein
MVTEVSDQPRTTNGDRAWLEFSFLSFSRIANRKHGFAVPDLPLDRLSDEELQRRVDLLRELAHLPPG